MSLSDRDDLRIGPSRRVVRKVKTPTFRRSSPLGWRLVIVIAVLLAIAVGVVLARVGPTPQPTAPAPSTSRPAETGPLSPASRSDGLITVDGHDRSAN